MEFGGKTLDIHDPPEHLNGFLNQDVNEGFGNYNRFYNKRGSTMPTKWLSNTGYSPVTRYRHCLPKHVRFLLVRMDGLSSP